MENDIRNLLIDASRTAMEHAYAPYSRFRVGAAVLGASGRIHSGCNVENASYGLTVCAERTAILKAISEGEHEITTIAVACSSGKPEFPCGACLQVMSEFAPRESDMRILLVGDVHVQEYTLADLLPHAFRLDG